MSITTIEHNGAVIFSCNCTTEEAAGLLLYMDKHPHIPGNLLASVYLSNIRKGIDLVPMPVALPSSEQLNPNQKS